MIKNLELSECLNLLGRNYLGRVAFIFQGNPYIIPITYFHDANEKCILSYAAKGHKIQAMRNYGSVAFQVDEIKSIQEWKSVLVHGKFQELEGSTAKKLFAKICRWRTANNKNKRRVRRLSSSAIFRVDCKKNSMPIVYKISVEDIQGKIQGRLKLKPKTTFKVLCAKSTIV